MVLESRSSLMTNRTATNGTLSGRVSFGDFEFDVRVLELRKHGMKVKV